MFIAVSSTDPGTDGQSITEPSGGAYARISVSESDFSDPTLAFPSVTSNTGTLTYIKATADWVAGAPLTHFAVFRTLAGTAETDFIQGGALTTSRIILDTDRLEIAVGDFDISFGA
jgi:hypothetical protein